MKYLVLALLLTSCASLENMTPEQRRAFGQNLTGFSNQLAPQQPRNMFINPQPAPASFQPSQFCMINNFGEQFGCYPTLDTCLSIAGSRATCVAR